MKPSLIITVIFGIFVSAACAQPTTPEAFVTEVRAACEQKNGARLDALTYYQGASSEDREMVSKLRFSTWGNGKVKDVSLVSLPNDYTPVMIGRGKKIEPTYLPEGYLRIEITGSKYGNGNMSENMPYAKINGNYMIVTAKSTDLGWRGPIDETLGFFVNGAGSGKITVEYSWNASGVDQTSKIATVSRNFLGQHINWVKVTSDSPDANITLELSKGSKTTYVSEPLKGVGTLEYKKPD